MSNPFSARTRRRAQEGELRNRKTAMTIPSCCHFHPATLQMLLSGSCSFKSIVDTAMIYPIQVHISYSLKKGKHARYCKSIATFQIRKSRNISAKFADP
jgi:hypothetical protein